jgi:hypothetical protein
MFHNRNIRTGNPPASLRAAHPDEFVASERSVLIGVELDEARGSFVRIWLAGEKFFTGETSIIVGILAGEERFAIGIGARRRGCWACHLGLCLALGCDQSAQLGHNFRAFTSEILRFGRIILVIVQLNLSGFVSGPGDLPFDQPIADCANGAADALPARIRVKNVSLAA